jgi:hypothetical protein
MGRAANNGSMTVPARQFRMSVDALRAYRVFIAWVVVEYGPAYAPLLDRVERDLEEAKRQDPMQRARSVLEEPVWVAEITRDPIRGRLPPPAPTRS